ncbi:MAG: hypothetical protein UY39_C0026G0003 [Candidatus Kaiserbacteria bacterium GW2011_GWC2_49_12]|uniref:Uncharacterized protein n=4 Tax=Candidatus Kaiseribacteriota TaxID=1752734 RepID=A0A0G1ZF13_9BACT|nr:MAG: hypothetical protein UY39_C0026G0003 [Candidatus Kaiserbacteria bacterium GW2011_GWC2_49_12]KKW17824.1 MAG: hypothetical protein UY57_C0009G0002 [Candidatus Kaiserbacteria bacterium GW2011_GWB1_50_17]KKW18388.1 MAG: hypothetical protein UY59_C0007G0002 [Candidatus Kaiserbacteria bacterium GW2011_GWA1_50_28]OGG86656.1 MAG: hypothetical protein A3H15_00280 [Candidatus Kaiserbacteria bacterium RIFCSPLOWO2_12_FULL_50_28]HCM43807.1 hypothetical protein [Candidatus Kaiserbacteria bacterium]
MGIEETPSLPEKRDAEREMKTIRDFVHAYRDEHDITPTPGLKSELSCIGFGEGFNLFFRQLTLTVDGDGEWKSLEDPEIRKLALEEIEAQNRDAKNLQDD